MNNLEKIIGTTLTICAVALAFSGDMWAITSTHNFPLPASVFLIAGTIPITLGVVLLLWAAINDVSTTRKKKRAKSSHA